MNSYLLLLFDSTSEKWSTIYLVDYKESNWITESKKKKSELLL